MRFQPGQSGNPRADGRKSNFAIAELCRKHTEAAISALVAIMENSDALPAARVSAAAAILDRAWGKPAQARPEGPGGEVHYTYSWIGETRPLSPTETQ